MSRQHRIYQALEQIAIFTDRDVPLLQVLALLRIAQAGEQGIDQGQLSFELKASSAAVSRTVRALGEVHYLKDRQGFQLIDIALDPKDNRRRIAKLTPKGRQLLSQINAVLDR